MPSSSTEISAPPAGRLLVLLAWLNALGVTALVATELVMLSVSLDWALAGLFHLNGSAAYGLLAILFAATAFASWRLFRRALLTERQIISAPAPAGE